MATPPVFSAGAVLTADQMNAVGMWKITPSSATNGTISNGAVTIGNAVTSVTVNGVFSSDFDNYLVTINGGVASTNVGMQIQLGTTTTGYYAAGLGRSYSGTTNTFNQANVSSWDAVGIASTDNIFMNVHIFNPNLAKRSLFRTDYIFGDTAGGGDVFQIGGYLNNATQYTSFKILIASGTMTGGTIRVYGYRA